MFRRVYTLLSQLGGGSMRKRLYVRLGIVAVLLVSSVWGIAQLQSATRNSKEKDNKQQVAKNSEGSTEPPDAGQAAPRLPKPVPGKELDDDDAPSASNSFATLSAQQGDKTTSERQAGDKSDTRSNNNRWNNYTGSRGKYSVLDDQKDDDQENGETEGDDANTTYVNNETDAEADATGDDPPPQEFSMADFKKKQRYSVNDDEDESSNEGEQSEGGAGELQTAQQQISDASNDDEDSSSDTTDNSSDPAGQSEEAEEPGVLIASQANTDEGTSEELDTENPAALTQVRPQEAPSQPLRSMNTTSTKNIPRIGSRSSAPSLLPKTNHAEPIAESSQDHISLNPDSVPAIPPSNASSSSELLGPQTQQVTIEKIAPDEVQVGRPAKFEIIVRNVGQSPANQVVVMDRVPEGAELVETNPPASNNNGILMWDLGTMDAGSESLLSMTVTPQVEGEISSVATVNFAAQAAARTVSTKPVLKIDVEAPSRVLIGEWVDVVITVRNEGSGPARGVVIEADVPEGLHHPAGRELEQELGVLRQRDEQQITLVLAAEKAGNVAGMIRVHDDGHLDLQQPMNLEVVAPQLAVNVEGPKLRYLGRQASYTLSVANNGTATANNVELVAVLPPNLQFVSADKLGQYDLQQHAVYWNLEELPANKAGTVKLVTLPIQEGDRKLLRVAAHADLADSVEMPHDVTVSSIAELAFSISDSADPIEVGTETIYEIEVVNQGSKADTNIVLAVDFPEELQPLKGEGPTRAQASGQQLLFEPLGQLAAGDSVIYRVQAQGRIAGDPRILVRLQSDQMPKPVAKEESTKVYSD